MSLEEAFYCPYCPKKRISFDSLSDLGKHLSKKHGLNERKRVKIYRKLGYE
jgi:hypothetical protein